MKMLKIIKDKKKTSKTASAQLLKIYKTRENRGEWG